MKKLFFLLVLFPIILLAQGEPMPVPTSPVLTMDSFFTTLAGMVSGVLAIFSFLNTRILKKPMNDTWTQVATWVLAFALGLFGYWREWGIFYQVGIWWTLLYSLACGLVANGLFNLEIIKGVLEFLKLLVPMKNQPNKITE